MSPGVQGINPLLRIESPLQNLGETQHVAEEETPRVTWTGNPVLLRAGPDDAPGIHQGGPQEVSGDPGRYGGITPRATRTA